MEALCLHLLLSGKEYSMSGKNRLWFIVFGLVLGLGLWSLPSMAQETSSDTPVFVLSVGSRSCTLAADSVEVAQEATAEASAAPRATYRPTLTPIPQPANADETPEAEAAVEGFSSGELVVLTLSDDCADLIEQLEVPENGTLWLSISLENDPETSLPLSTLADDEYPPQLDRRGRFFGCEIGEQGEQVCRVVVTVDDVSYQIDVPVVVQGAFIAPEPTSAPTSAPAEPTSAPAPVEPPPPATTQEP
jgi:hypothetical protein